MPKIGGRRKEKMYVHCNPNPLGKATGDCVVRAIAIATNRSWREAYRAVCRQGEIDCDMPSNNSVWGNMLRSEGFREFLLPEACPRCVTVRAFSEMYPEGVYVIGTGSHAVAVIDGDWYDAWDSGDEVPSYFWRRA
jgi:hypothetical protein